MNQSDFAKELGISYRSYQERLSGRNPDWRFSELVKMVQINEKEPVLITLGEKTYVVSIEEV